MSTNSTQNKMNQKDRELIRRSILIDDWGMISPLEEEAESDEAKKILHDRMVHLYRKEEAFADQL